MIRLKHNISSLKNLSPVLLISIMCWCVLFDMNTNAYILENGNAYRETRASMPKNQINKGALIYVVFLWQFPCHVSCSMAHITFWYKGILLLLFSLPLPSSNKQSLSTETVRQLDIMHLYVYIYMEKQHSQKALKP